MTPEHILGLHLLGLDGKMRDHLLMLEPGYRLLIEVRQDGSPHLTFRHPETLFNQSILITGIELLASTRLSFQNTR